MLQSSTTRVRYVLQAVVAVGLLLSVATAVADELTTKLLDLLRAGEAQAAYALADARLAEFEGDSEFDLLYGIAALDSGHAGHAVFALERVLFAQPGNVRARLELARGYYVLGEDGRARAEFEALRADDPPASVAATIDRYLDAIRTRAQRSRPSFGGHIGLVAGYDSNVNGATDADRFSSPLLGPLALADASREAASNFAGVRAGLRYLHPLRKGRDLFAEASIDRRWLADHDAFADAQYSVVAGARFAADADAWTATGTYRRHDIGGEHYRDLLGVTLDWQRLIAAETRAGVWLHAARISYPAQVLRDADQWLGGATWVRAFAGHWRPRLQLGAYGGVERAHRAGSEADSLASRDLYGVQAQLVLNPAEALSLHAGLLFQASRYGALNEFLGVRRDEDYSRATLGAALKIAPRWVAGIEASYARNRANSVIYDSTRWQLEASIRHEFD